MKKNLGILLVLVFITFPKVNAFFFSHDSRVKVTPDDLKTTPWDTEEVNSDPTQIDPDHTLVTFGTSHINVVNGPLNPPLGQGSVELTQPKPAGSTSTLKRVRLRNSNYGGTLLRDIKDLRYSTYIVNYLPTPNVVVAPSLVLQIANDPDNYSDFNISFTPQSQSSTKVLLNKWQEWDAFNGSWTLNILDKLGRTLSTAPAPPTVPLGNLKTGLFTLSTYLMSYPDARIINTTIDDDPGDHGGGIRLVTGTGTNYDNFKGYIDAFKICSKDAAKIYDFELGESETNPDRSICSGDATVIGPPKVDGITYSWTSDKDGKSFIKLTNANITVSPTTNTTYTLIETTKTGCVYKSTEIIKVKPFCIRRVFKRKIIYLIIIPFFLWGCFMAIRYMRNQRSKNINQ